MQDPAQVEDVTSVAAAAVAAKPIATITTTAVRIGLDILSIGFTGPSSLSDFRRKSFVVNDNPFQLETVNTVI